jgi:hypothetical protein
MITPERQDKETIPMPISGIGSYAPTMQEFINHWTAVNATLGATPLTLRGTYTLAMFTTDRTSIITAVNNTISATNTAQITAGALEAQKANLLLRAIQFRKWVEGYLPGSPYEQALPVAPKIGAAESKFLDPLQDILNLWGTINGDAAITGVPLPITLSGGYVVATFTTDLNNLRGAFVAAKNASEQATLVRRQRDVLLKPAEQRIKQYRDVIQARYLPTDPFVQSLPALSPAPGSTPDPVQVSGGWNSTAQEVQLQWQPSPNPKLAAYEVRGCIGSVYKAENAFVIANIKEGTTAWSGIEGVEFPSAKCVYRVYVLLTTGNERGSNDVAVIRP